MNIKFIHTILKKIASIPSAHTCDCTQCPEREKQVESFAYLKDGLKDHVYYHLPSYEHDRSLLALIINILVSGDKDLARLQIHIITYLENAHD